MIKKDKVLFLGAHADDEISCAGTLAKLIQSGSEVHMACFSFCEESVPKELDRNVLRSEYRFSTIETLGVNPRNIYTYKYPVRRLPEHRQDILEQLIIFRDEIMPDIVLLPTSADRHQDHATISIEGMRAFKQRTILGYEMPRNISSFPATCFVVLNDSQYEIKMAARKCYESQYHRDGMCEDYLRSLLRIRGVQCGEKYAEAYEVLGVKI